LENDFYFKVILPEGKLDNTLDEGVYLRDVHYECYVHLPTAGLIKEYPMNSARWE